MYGCVRSRQDAGCTRVFSRASNVASMHGCLCVLMRALPSGKLVPKERRGLAMVQSSHWDLWWPHSHSRGDLVLCSSQADGERLCWSRGSAVCLPQREAGGDPGRMPRGTAATPWMGCANRYMCVSVCVCMWASVCACVCVSIEDPQGRAVSYYTLLGVC